MNQDFFPEQFRENSIKLQTALTKEERHKEGIFFTPKNVREKLFAILEKYPAPKTILEPCFGTGEFLYDAKTAYPNANIIGVEQNKKLFESVHLPGMILQDFLKYTSEKVDCIIGNPPYFVTKDKNEECMTGRGNIFVQFLYKCLKDHLNAGGILAMILPTSFLNCSYYEPCRKYIAENATIEHIEVLKDTGFYDTNQETILFVVKLVKADKEKPYIFERAGKVYFSPMYKDLREIVRNTTTLQALQMNVKTGDIVWNEWKEDLHDTEGTCIVYSTNIVNNELCLNNITSSPDKKQCLKKKTDKLPLRGPAIVVNRGYGNAYELKYAFIPNTMDFFGENHVNVIMPTSEESNANIETVLRSFRDERTRKFIEMFVGNGALSKTELETVLPIFL